MDKLNKLLWLKCKINSRLALGNKSSSLSLFVFFVVIYLFWLLPVTAGSTFNILLSSPESVKSSIHILFAGVYCFWVLMPVLGYRLSGVGDFSGLSIYPLSPWDRLVATFAGSFLDVPFIMFFTILVVPLIFYSWASITMIWSIFILILFLSHTVAIGQLLIVLLRIFFDGQSLWDCFLKICKWGFFLFLWVSQCVLYLFFLTGEFYELFTVEFLREFDITWITLLFPPGISGEAIYLMETGDISGSFYWGFILFTITILTFLVTSMVSEGYMSGKYVFGKSKSSKNGAESFFSKRASDLFDFIGAGKSKFLNLLWKDLLILVREPQYRILLFVFLLLELFICFVCVYLSVSANFKAFEFFWVALFPAFFALGTIALNCLALERRGLSYLCQSPITSIEIIVSKTMSVVLIQLVSFCVGLILLYFIVGLNWWMIFCFLIGGFCWFPVSTALNHIVAVLVPMPLPAGGVVQTNSPGPMKALYQSLIVSFVLFASSFIALPLVCLIAIVYFSESLVSFFVFLPFFALFFPGVAGLGILVSALIFDWRQEKFIVEVVE